VEEEEEEENPHSLPLLVNRAIIHRPEANVVDARIFPHHPRFDFFELSIPPSRGPSHACTAAATPSPRSSSSSLLSFSTADQS